MKKPTVFAVCLAIVLSCSSFLGAVHFSWAAEDSGAAVKRKLVIPYDQAEKLLEDLERGKMDGERAAACEDALNRGIVLVEDCKAAKESLGKRVDVLTKDRDEALAMAKEATETGKKIGKTPWYKRLWDAGKWALIGAAIGFAAGVGR
jgi:exonuclease VII small subunit